jgi:hypothetical protein
MPVSARAFSPAASAFFNRVLHTRIIKRAELRREQRAEEELAREVVEEAQRVRRRLGQAIMARAYALVLTTPAERDRNRRLKKWRKLRAAAEMALRR